jgi:hypothetical protein
MKKKEEFVDKKANTRDVTRANKPFRGPAVRRFKIPKQEKDGNRRRVNGPSKLRQCNETPALEESEKLKCRKFAFLHNYHFLL